MALFKVNKGYLMQLNNFTCFNCGSGFNISVREGMVICLHCGAIIMDYRNSLSKECIYKKDQLGPLDLDVLYTRCKKFITQLSEALKIPAYITTEAFRVSRLLSSNIALRKKGHKLIALIALLYAIRLHGYPINYNQILKFVTKYFNLKRVKRVSLLNLLFKSKEHFILISRGDPLNYLNLYLSELLRMDKVTKKLSKYKIDADTYKMLLINTALEIYNRYRQFFLGKKPETTAGLLLYLANLKLRERGFNRMFSQDDVAYVTGLSKYCYRERVSEFFRYTREPIFRVRKIS
ncbi:MAG: cyclin family protein [Candidatus Geothermarchaeota archaeon]